jgi:hypothetical protein
MEGLASLGLGFRLLFISNFYSIAKRLTFVLGLQLLRKKENKNKRSEA